ncbi:MAG: hypothetical protein AAF939_18980 [Planctomycetota bacterium]
MTIKDLDCNDEVEAAIWAAFESWGDPFKKRLAENGPQWVLDGLIRLLERIEDPNTAVLRDDWVGYLSRRDALHILEKLVPSSVWKPYWVQTRTFDQKLRHSWIHGECLVRIPPKPEDEFWWYYGVPEGLSETLDS